MNRSAFGNSNAAYKIKQLVNSSAPFSVRRTGTAVWCHRSASTQSFVTFEQLSAMRDIDAQLMTAGLGDVSYKVLCSDHPRFFSLGGDLSLFIRCVEEQDEQTLSEYAILAIRAIWANASGLGARQINTIALVTGEAQGGGFEAALSCDLLVAEAGTSFGFPETLFGMFPGMGGELLLRGRVDNDLAKKLVTSAHRYSAEMLFEMGIVDYLASKGKGAAKVQEAIRTQNHAELFERRQKRLETVRYTELLDSVDVWVAQAMSLSARHLRAMKYICSAQH